MSSDNFDNELATLYQQRKAQVVAPDVSLKAPSTLSQLSPLSILAIFSAATVASFSIMAVINHLSNATTKQAPVYNTTHQVEIADITPVTTDETEKTITLQPPLPPKPATNTIIQPTLIDVETQNTNTFVAPKKIATSTIQQVTLPQLTQPQLAQTPTYKVLPKYQINAEQPPQNGAVKLNYTITAEGTVSNIEVTESSVNRKLVLATKKALKQWRYVASDSAVEGVDIVFEFKVDE